ncbi:hypothetical protein CS022_14425 [Veronia nyctiphanis]|uniref:DUF3630 family protein n=1 Tax=Veronia nyctiphanis TaxID=1278244 RepID=A0A4Q0YNT6_9GAMM|nr:DUF3630 family protein [Veronia nyctiphanis]RXJ72637.1 hypothetical protein CS022_14425 [Veronia nyctiphanis]
MDEMMLLPFNPDSGRLILTSSSLDFDSAETVAESFFTLIGATVKEKQLDADLLSWLIDFEGCQLMAKAEHYSASLWLETMGENGLEELLFLSQWLPERAGIQIASF